MDARDVRSPVPLLIVDWIELTHHVGIVRAVVGGVLLYDEGCRYECVCLLLALRALRARDFCSSL